MGIVNSKLNIFPFIHNKKSKICDECYIRFYVYKHLSKRGLHTDVIK